MIKKVKIEEFQIYGPSVRTNNALEMSASGKISNLWQKFYASNLDLAANTKTYGVYSNYESDATGEFTVTAGIKVESGAEASVIIKSGTYLAFLANGPMPAVIIDAWKSVWMHFSEKQPYERAYETDFEEYNGPESAIIYIGIK